MTKRILIYVSLVTSLLLAPRTLDARWMNPQTGRFWTMDTFDGDSGGPQTLHKYMYAEADPINKSDPSGMFASGSSVETLVAGAGEYTLQTIRTAGLAEGKKQATLSIAKIGVGVALAIMPVLLSGDDGEKSAFTEL